jgi:hypothetical protein
MNLMARLGVQQRLPPVGPIHPLVLNLTVSRPIESSQVMTKPVAHSPCAHVMSLSAVLRRRTVSSTNSLRAHGGLQVQQLTTF